MKLKHTLRFAGELAISFLALVTLAQPHRITAQDGPHAPAGVGTPQRSTDPSTTLQIPAAAPTHSPSPHSSGADHPSHHKTKEVTADDQSNNSKDVEMTAKIRRAIVSVDSLSTQAQNVKIITRKGRVTLRGEVVNDYERTVVENAAKDVAGATHVDSQLKVNAK